MSLEATKFRRVMTQIDLLKEELEQLGQGHIISQCEDFSETNPVIK
jgi:hypothetical protein